MGDHLVTAGTVSKMMAQTEQSLVDNKNKIALALQSLLINSRRKTVSSSKFKS